MEDKIGFTNDFVEALIKHGDGRYDDLMDHVIRCVEDGEYAPGDPSYFLQRGGSDRYLMEVTGESLTALAKDIVRLVE